jgi:hypothetical protein
MQRVNVASGSPVSVSTTPFMADASGNAGGGPTDRNAETVIQVGRVSQFHLNP